MSVNTVVRKELKASLKIYNTIEIHKIGKLNDQLLKELVSRIRKNPTLDNFIVFVNCLNYFYSTRLQASKGNNSELIIKVAKILKANWKAGILLKNEIAEQELSCYKIDNLRDQIFASLKRNAYSFSTKVFHQLNYAYPILDANVNCFLKKEGYGVGVGFYTNNYQVFYDVFHRMVKDMQWPTDQINTIDRAIWGIVARNEKKYFSARYKKKLEKLQMAKEEKRLKRKK